MFLTVAFNFWSYLYTKTHTFKPGLHVRRKHKNKHKRKHKPRVNRDDASTIKRNAFLFFLCLR